MGQPRLSTICPGRWICPYRRRRRKNPYTKERAKKDALIFGISKKKLRQEALAKGFDYITLIKAALGYEKSRKTSGTIRATTIDVSELVHTQDEVDNIVARIIAGRCSAGRPRSPNQDTLEAPKCQQMPSTRPAKPASCKKERTPSRHKSASSPPPHTVMATSLSVTEKLWR